jgi:hypothetical protein
MGEGQQLAGGEVDGSEPGDAADAVAINRRRQLDAGLADNLDLDELVVDDDEGADAIAVGDQDVEVDVNRLAILAMAQGNGGAAKQTPVLRETTCVEGIQVFGAAPKT